MLFIKYSSHWVVHLVIGSFPTSRWNCLRPVTTWNRRQQCIVIQLKLPSNTMHYIPEDILAYIFPYAAAGSLLTAIRISHVSQEWREIALSLSQLWNHFEYILGIEVAQLQMSRISRTVAISVGITLWDIDAYSQSATAHDTCYRSIKWWLEHTQILGHPHWNALHIELSGLPERAGQIFDLISMRKDPLDNLHIRFPYYAYDLTAAEATIMKLQFRPMRFHLEGLQFPLGLLGTYFQDLSSLKYGGGFKMREVMVVPEDTSIAVLPRLSTVELHNVNARSFLTHARAPSLSYLHLSNAFDHDPHHNLLQVGTFAPSLRRLRIYASTDILCQALSPDIYFPGLTSLEIELRDSESTRAFMVSLQSLDFEVSFPQLQMFTLIRAFIYRRRLRDMVGLPERAFVIRLIGCTNATVILEVPAHIDLQIIYGDDVQTLAGCEGDNDEEEFSLGSDKSLDGSSEESGWGIDSEVGSMHSGDTFMSDRSEFRVSLSTHEKRMLETGDISPTDDEDDEYMVDMDGDVESDLAEGRLESMELS